MLKDQVRKFYKILWEDHDKSAIPDILHQGFTFRGSLGQEKQGHDGFAEYVDMVHEALGEYECLIRELVAENNKVFAKMTFSGIHKGQFLGYNPSHMRVSWDSCALFTFEHELIKDAWVLGDLKGLEEQLARNQQL